VKQKLKPGIKIYLIIFLWQIWQATIVILIIQSTILENEILQEKLRVFWNI